MGKCFINSGIFTTDPDCISDEAIPISSQAGAGFNIDTTLDPAVNEKTFHFYIKLELSEGAACSTKGSFTIGCEFADLMASFNDLSLQNTWI